MTKNDALLLMLEHSKCLSAKWVISPEGREYKARFDAAIVALSDGVKVGYGDMPEDLSKCPQCGGEADNGHDRCYPPTAYMCSKCNVVAVQLQTILELEAELKRRDKCSYMGPMRDCPTHGDSKDAARYQWLKRQPWVKTKGIHAWGELLDNAIDEARHDAPTETPND